MGVCTPWVTPDDLPAERATLSGGVTWDEVCQMASDILFDLSGRRWTGDCGQVTARLSLGDDGVPTCCGTGRGYPPMDQFTDAGWSGYPSAPILLSGEVYNITCCTPAKLRLPDTTARDVVSVTERGTVRDPSTYELRRGGWLVDLSLRGWWPCGTAVEVVYSAGWAPPAGGKVAARLFALELGKLLAGDGTCRLPSRVQNVLRQGVTMASLDKLEDLDKGRIGYYPVDMWLSSVTRTVRGGAVWSPDIPTAHRV